MGKISLIFGGIPVTATKVGVWHVEAGENVASARFLDEALEELLPHLRPSERDRLLIRLLYLANRPDDAIGTHDAGE